MIQLVSIGHSCNEQHRQTCVYHQAKKCQNGLLSLFRCNVLSLGAFKIASSHRTKVKIRLRKEKQAGYTPNYSFGELSSVSADRTLSLSLKMTFSHIRKFNCPCCRQPLQRGLTVKCNSGSVFVLTSLMQPHQSHGTCS